MVMPSKDSKRIDELARALAAPVPAEAEAKLAGRMLKTGQAHVEVMRGLLDALSARDIAAYLEVSARHIAVRDELQAINDDSKTTCGRPLAKPGLPAEVIQSTIRQAYPVFQKCYEAGLARDPKLTGLVAVRFEIDRNGDVRDVKRVNPEHSESPGPDPGTEGFFESLGFGRARPRNRAQLPDELVAECIVNHFRTLRFPRPTTGKVTVIYPINLEPG